MLKEIKKIKTLTSIDLPTSDEGAIILKILYIYLYVYLKESTSGLMQKHAGAEGDGEDKKIPC